MKTRGRIIGVDEVGRGCFAGPVVACAVMMPSNTAIDGVKDSKKLTPSKREKLSVLIIDKALSVGLGVVCNILIDKIGIVPATKEAMQRALGELREEANKAEQIVVDAVKLNNLPVPYIHPFKADDIYFEVSCASIVAKVYRDNLMRELGRLYPAYQWDKNKGYGTKAHIDAIKDKGVSPLHRTSFLKNIKYPKGVLC